MHEQGVRAVKVGSMPASLRIARVFRDLNFEQGAIWKGTCDDEGRGVRFVDYSRGRKRSFFGKGSDLLKWRNGRGAAMAVVPESVPDPETRGSRFCARGPCIPSWSVMCWRVEGEITHDGDRCGCIYGREARTDGK